MLLARTLGRFLGRGTQAERAFFDPAYYRRSYPDIVAAGIDPFEHYMRHGWREGRNPSASFATLYYRDAHLDGEAINPLTHYAGAGGIASGLTTWPSAEAYLALQRQISADLFDNAHYRAQGPISNADLLGDYLTEGWRQGRSPSPTFDAAHYTREHIFLAALDVSPLYHHASQVRMRGLGVKRPSKPGEAPRTEAFTPKSIARDEILQAVEPVFDADYYLRCHEDVRLAKIDPLTHFVDYGWRENRNPTALFDVAYYRARNPDVVKRGINPFYHYVSEGQAQGRRGSPVGTVLHPPLVAPSEAAWAAATPAARTDTAEVIVIMPVYSGYDETLAAIHAVLSETQAIAFALHVINDVTPDPKLDAALEDLAARGLFSYSRNKRNIGFVKTCNRGLREFADKPVVLLNADARVFGDWLDRMMAHAARDATIATITPLSNNATIASYPVVNGNNRVEPGMSAADLDRMAATVNAGRAIDAPTGIGFCFYMSKASRDAIGILDEEAFGRGYGEENDFCMRAAKAGFRNVIAEDIFVYHAGEVSFASFVTAEYGPGQKALLAKHPDYPSRVRFHLAADPGLAGRMRLDLHRLALWLGQDCFVFVSHALIGGVVTHIEQMQKRLLAEGTKVVQIRVGVGDRWSVEITSDAEDAPFTPNLRPTGFNQIRPLLEEFLAQLKPRAFHLHSLVGFDWSATTGFLDLVRSSGLPYYFTLHDYSVVCHRHNLVLTTGRFCGLPSVEVCKSCVSTDRSYPEAIDPAVRRATFDAFLTTAAGVFAPSADTRTRLLAAGANYDIRLRPHETEFAPLKRAKRPAIDETFLDIAIVGAIGDAKGSGILLALARDAKARALPLRFHIVGYSNATEALRAEGVEETGRFDDEADAAEKIAAIEPAMIFLPSVWPETFCYALSIAFDLDIPPVVFDLGAPAERIAAANFGFRLPYALIDDARALNDKLLALPWSRERREAAARRPLYPSILADYYDLPADDTAAATLAWSSTSDVAPI